MTVEETETRQRRRVVLQKDVEARRAHLSQRQRAREDDLVTICVTAFYTSSLEVIHGTPDENLGNRLRGFGDQVEYLGRQFDAFWRAKDLLKTVSNLRRAHEAASIEGDRTVFNRSARAVQRCFTVMTSLVQLYLDEETERAAFEASVANELQALTPEE